MNSPLKSPAQSLAPGYFSRRKGSTLLIALSFILLMTVISVAFLVRSRTSLQVSQSYSKEIIATEIAKLGVDKVAADFQNEIAAARAESPPRNLFLPPRIGVVDLNPRANPLVRRTVGDATVASPATASYTAGYTAAGFATVPHANSASDVNTETPSKNGWSFSKARWQIPGLLPSANFAAPDWVYVDKQVSTTATLTPGDVVGRYAAVVYDVGGLLDVNEAGTPLANLRDKGSTIFADLPGLYTDLGLPSANADTLTDWRGDTSTVTLTDYYGSRYFPEVADPAQAGRLETPVSTLLTAGENIFFSRMELIQAANKGQLGLSSTLLPYFRTRSQIANRVSLEDVYADGSSTPFIMGHPSLAAAADTVIKVARIKDPPLPSTFNWATGATRETFTVKEGSPLPQNRFPLARLRWLASRQANGTPNYPVEIKRYFGLTWDATLKGFIYTSPDNATAQPSIRTLVDLCTAINAGTILPREPDFFEWLKAAINPDSLGQTGGSTDRIFSVIGQTVGWEASKDLHIVRIGANIIDQSDADSVPTPIRSRFTGVALNNPGDPPDQFDSFGQENLPYLNEMITTVVRNGANLEGYLQFELWNPNRNAPTLATPPRNFNGNDNSPRNDIYMLSTPPLDYGGYDISNFRVRVIKGRAVMEPFTYVNAVPVATPLNDFAYVQITTNPMYPTALTGNDAFNSAWQSLKRIYEISQRNLTAASFSSPALANTTVNFGMNVSGGFFSEPYLVNGSKPNSEDTTNPVTMALKTSAPTIDIRALLGAASSGILVCSVVAPNPAFTALKFDEIYTCNTPPAHFSTVSGTKAFNAVTFTSDGSTIFGVPTESVTVAVEVQVHDGSWHTTQIYNHLGMDVRGANPGGRQRAIISGDQNTKSQNTIAAWAATSDTVAPPNPGCFDEWDEWQGRKGYNNTDPRTERFGLCSQIYASPGTSIRTHTAAWSGNGINWNLPHGLTTSVGTDFGGGAPSNEGPAPGWNIVDAASANVSVPADMALNIPAALGGEVANGQCYSDADGVIRPADARWADATAHPALPANPASGLTSGGAGSISAYPNALDSRPAIINRPFRSVAELGFAFRDVPWKSLDLFSPNSADRRLLDVFSITDSATVTAKINPNLAQQATLSALLHGAALDPSYLNTLLVSDANADNVAIALASLDPNTVADRITSLENLAERINNNPASTPTTGDTVRSHKPRVENYLRALSSTSDTRNWQLMLDVVAQSGRIAPGSANPADFIVDGQRRLFLYLTLDRITGEIVDKHVEPVYE